MEYSEAEKRRREKRLSEIRLSNISFDKTKQFGNPYDPMKEYINMKKIMHKPNSEVQRNGEIAKIS